MADKPGLPPRPQRPQITVPAAGRLPDVQQDQDTATPHAIPRARSRSVVSLPKPSSVALPKPDPVEKSPVTVAARADQNAPQTSRSRLPKALPTPLTTPTPVTEPEVDVLPPTQSVQVEEAVQSEESSKPSHRGKYYEFPELFEPTQNPTKSPATPWYRNTRLTGGVIGGTLVLSLGAVILVSSLSGTDDQPQASIFTESSNVVSGVSGASVSSGAPIPENYIEVWAPKGEYDNYALWAHRWALEWTPLYTEPGYIYNVRGYDSEDKSQVLMIQLDLLKADDPNSQSAFEAQVQESSNRFQKQYTLGAVDKVTPVERNDLDQYRVGVYYTPTEDKAKAVTVFNSSGEHIIAATIWISAEDDLLVRHFEQAVISALDIRYNPEVTSPYDEE